MTNQGSETTGIVFDIQRASFHDGPGIRTTVFLKGCPLHCLWCHNPEAVSRQPQLFFYSQKCRLCGDCASACPEGAHSIVDGVHQIQFERCTACGDCVPACSQRALKISGQEMSVSQVMQEVTADRDFYEATGGGLTLSGGEPMAQFAFTRDLLRAAQAQGIHTCLQTSGFAPQKMYAQLLPYVDLFQLDYKITGSSEHKKYTGVRSELILANLDFLYQSGKPIVLRCPIIPGINDTPQHFSGIQALNARYPNLAGVEILPYHDMGNNKRTSIGQQMTLVDLKSTPPALAEEWLVEIKNLGCEKARIG